MAGFIRRYDYFPAVDIITLIEGVVIADIPPPGSVQGVSQGVAGIVGEFSDMTYATAVNSSGVVSTKHQQVEIRSAQDLLNKVGGWDETLGEFGGSLGNGFQALRSKKYSRLICAPVNLADSQGTRYLRDLPLSTSPTNINPVVPMSAATVVAGREFRVASVGRVRVAARKVFTGNTAFATGTGGSTSAGGSAATQVFNGATDWTTIPRPDGSIGTYVGDILVIGNNNAGAKQPVAEAGTYRVQATPVSGTAVTVEKLDGSNFVFTSQTTVPWRLHTSSDADTAPVKVPGSSSPGGYAAADIGGYTTPTRPITNPAGGNTNGSYTQGLVMAPAVSTPATTGSSWDPLSGLEGRIKPGGSGGLTFTAATQRINAPANATIDALYSDAITATDTEDEPAHDINIIWAARKSSTIRNDILQNALNASQHSVGRMGIISPDLAQQDIDVIISGTDPGISAHNERLIYTWPGAVTNVPEAANFQIKTADGQTTIDGNLDETFDSYYASVLSNLQPELNPGQAAPPIPSLLAPVLGIQRGVSGLNMNDYIALKANGVSALRIDRNVGPVIQSGITTSLTSGQTTVNRRRMDDYITDSLAAALVAFVKLPVTNQFKDAVVGEAVAFLDQLLSPANPTAQRIADYQVDDKSGNTQQLNDQGIFVLIVRVKLLATGDFIVLQAEIGQTVNILPLAA